MAHMRYSEDVGKAQPRASARAAGGTADVCGHGQAAPRGRAESRVRSPGQSCKRESKDASLAKNSVGRLSVGEADKAPSSALTPKHPIGAETGSALKLFPTAVYHGRHTGCVARFPLRSVIGPRRQSLPPILAVCAPVHRPDLS